MKNRNKITSIKDLKIRKKKLRMEMELTKREFSHSLGTSRADLKDFLLQNVVLPTGIAGLGVAGLSKLMSGSTANESAQNKTIIKKQGSSFLLKTLMPLFISAVQTYFFKKTAEQNGISTSNQVPVAQNNAIPNGHYAAP